jgi:hypothetical protein
MDNYEKSNNIENLNTKFSEKTKKLFKTLQLEIELNENNLQSIANLICKDLNCSTPKITLVGTQLKKTQNGKLKMKVLGAYNPLFSTVKIYKYTAIKQKKVAPKTSLDTLLHELCHHFDYKILGLSNSIHSSGFYKRISNLKQNLLN